MMRSCAPVDLPRVIKFLVATAHGIDAFADVVRTLRSTVADLLGVSAFNNKNNNDKHKRDDDDNDDDNNELAAIRKRRADKSTRASGMPSDVIALLIDALRSSLLLHRDLVRAWIALIDSAPSTNSEANVDEAAAAAATKGGGAALGVIDVWALLCLHGGGSVLRGAGDIDASIRRLVRSSRLDARLLCSAIRHAAGPCV